MIAWRSIIMLYLYRPRNKEIEKLMYPEQFEFHVNPELIGPQITAQPLLDALEELGLGAYFFAHYLFNEV